MSRTPHKYQVEGIEWLKTKLAAGTGVLLADDMGLGKTYQAIEAVRQVASGRKLCVVPALARETWARELAEAGQSFALALPRNDKRWEEFHSQALTAQWIVTSYELLEEWFKFAFEKKAPEVLVCDEAHMLKGRSTRGKMSKRAEVVRGISTVVPRRLLLSGTPLADRPRDLYNLLTIMAGGTRKWGSPWSFDVKYCEGHRGDHGWENRGKSNAEELRARLAEVMLRREKRDVAAQLPSLTRQVIWLDPDSNGVGAFRNAIATRSTNATATALIATLEAKIPAAVELAVSAERFLLLTWLKEHAHTMARLIQKQGVECAVITGEMDTAQREKVVKWAAERRIGVVATLDSVWQAMDSLKHVASFGIMHALRHQWLMMAQGEARLHRIGQTDPVHWAYLACRETMDALIIRNVVEKMDHFREIMPSTVEATSLRDSLVGAEVDMRSLYDGL